MLQMCGLQDLPQQLSMAHYHAVAAHKVLIGLSLNCRDEQECVLPIAESSTAQEFVKSYKREFGFTLELRKIIVDDLRVRATGRVRCPMHERTCMLHVGVV